ncbi:unnamed protein product [Adineta steineri]|uniref:G-protein coupled receptors family 1 profile domain-containing protein n=2 Tax=Adineta steineri TaxID=433720 RepID=A0A814BUP3_9BILA|nr:unnamed protein product [Adineta steineri]
MAVKVVLTMSLICFIICLHIPILMSIRDGVCGMFDSYKLIYAIYQIIIVGLLPPILMIIFSSLTVRNLWYRHTDQIRVRNRDRYLMRMLVAEVIIDIVTSIPYSINLVYGAITYYGVSKSSQRLEIEAFITFITQFLIYLIGVAPFYLFISTAKPFRKRFMNLFLTYGNKCISRHIRVFPADEQITTGQ